MGMKQKRCPLCKKERRFEEGFTSRDKSELRPVWKIVDGQKICPICISRSLNLDKNMDQDPLNL